MSEKIKVYGHPFCPMVGPVRGILNRTEVEYDYINIHQDNEARKLVREINNGNESVPTLVFADDSTLTEPSGGELQAKLETLGYTVPTSARIIANLPQLVILGVIAYGILSLLGIL